MWSVCKYHGLCILYTRIRRGSKCYVKIYFNPLIQPLTEYKPLIQRVLFYDLIPNNGDSGRRNKHLVASLLRIKVFNYMGLTWGFLIQRRGKEVYDVITAVWGWKHTLIIIVIITLNSGKWIVAHIVSVSNNFILTRSNINNEGIRFLYVSV